MKSTPNRFRLSPRGVMVAIVSAAFSNPALANTGKVDFTIGNVTVTGSDGRGRPLTKGAEVKSGDKILSSVDGRAQIRFSDGAYVSLQPNTEFDVKEYRYSGKTDGTESALFGLFKGAMRTVTGLVGRTNKNRYRITTATATIGIRGTGGLIAIGADGSTLVTGTSGIWTLSNKGGTIDIPAGSAGIAGANVNVPPQPANLGPVVPPPQSAPQLLPTIVQGDVVRTAANAASIVPTSGAGRAVAFFGAGGTNNSVIGGPTTVTPSNGTFDSSGLLTQFDQSVTTYTLIGTQIESGTDGFLSWGRWIGEVLVNGAPVGPITTNQGLHYVAGLPTPAASMPTGGTFTYNMIGATSPTFGNGLGAPGVLNSASLTGSFATGAITASVTATAGISTFSGTASGSITGSTFSGLVGTGTATNGGCSGGCSLGVNGFFAGTGATHAGFVYQFGNVFQVGLTTLSGAVALIR